MTRLFYYSLISIAWVLVLSACAPVFPPVPPDVSRPDADSTSYGPHDTKIEKSGDPRDTLLAVLRTRDSVLSLREGKALESEINTYLKNLEHLRDSLFKEIGWPSLSLDSPAGGKKSPCSEWNGRDSTGNYQPWLSCLQTLKSERHLKDLLEALGPPLDDQLPPKILIQALLLYGDALELAGKKQMALEVFALMSEYAAEFNALSEVAEKQIDLLQFQEDSLGEEIKTELEALNLSFNEGALYPVISRKALALLERLQNGKIRRSVKQVVSLSWERDGKTLAHSLDSLAALHRGGADREEIARLFASIENTFAHLGSSSVDSLRIKLNLGGISKNQSPDSVYRESEELIQKGKYLTAVEKLKTLLNSELHESAREKIARAGTLFCSEKRERASNYFKTYNNSKEREKQLDYLKKAQVELNGCLSAFPDLPISKKVKKNQTLIQSKLEKLENLSD